MAEGDVVRGSLRIHGLTRIADKVRRELAQPVSVVNKQALARLVSQSIRQVDQILADHMTRIHALPTPTRLAYEFLAGLDIDPIESTDSETGRCRPRESVSLSGLTSNWEQLLSLMSNPDARPNADRLHASVSDLCRIVEQHVEIRGCQPHELTQQTRQIRGWLAFFSQRESFDAYLAAADRARTIFETSMKGNLRFRAPACVQYRPVRSLYQLRALREGTRVVLPTPMISFTSELMQLLAAMALKRIRAKRQVMEVILGDEYQAIQAELDTLGGVSDETAGVYHNLSLSFDRVNRAYFGNAIDRPRLTWSRVFTGRKFGHYDHIRDTVMVSATLDRSGVPEYVLESVMHHELLHKRLGVNWRNGRMTVHTPEFRNLERRFRQFADAESFLKRLATRHR